MTFVLGKMVVALLGAHPSFVAQSLQFVEGDTYSCKVATTDPIISNGYAGRRAVDLCRVNLKPCVQSYRGTLCLEV